MNRTPTIHLPPVSGAIITAMDTADDPCDVCEDAMPALVIGDLDQRDQSAMSAHIASCNSCREIQQDWERELSSPAPPEETAPPEAATALGLRRGHYGFMDSPVGDLLLVVTDSGVCDVSYLANHDREDRFGELEGRGILATERAASVAGVKDELREYFGGQRNAFSTPVDLYGVTPFTRGVLEATSEVPFGNLRTYQGVAASIGNPKASRAVGNALGRNRVPVIVPCDHVVRSDGSMGWYTGGAEIKLALLGIEGVTFT
ncbi:MAG: methylated-DNA--[protein]-cysteine S-methyltransferase [Chloroflexia bacterium]|nr:methylated-DNA--[protein]-cysteine S-methyltransferase [Chloroflexia bacterium]